MQRQRSNKRLVMIFCFIYIIFLLLMFMWPWCRDFACTHARTQTQTCKENTNMSSCHRLPTKSEPTSSKTQTHGIVFAASQARSFLQVSCNTNLRTGKCREKLCVFQTKSQQIQQFSALWEPCEPVLPCFIQTGW